MSMSNTEPNKITWLPWLRSGLGWLFGAYLIFLYAHHVLSELAAGNGGLAVLGFDKEFFLVFVDHTLPLVLSLLLAWTARTLPPGRKRTAMTWVAWTAFVFLLAWWPWLRSLVTG
ncbi:MAG: hypothetical protein WBW92_08615 [Rhodanobacteraceae bacterium]